MSNKNNLVFYIINNNNKRIDIVWVHCTVRYQNYNMQFSRECIAHVNLKLLTIKTQMFDVINILIRDNIT